MSALPAEPSEDELRRFRALKRRLPGIWKQLESDPTHEHTSVIVPSLSVNQEELAKVLGAGYYEERLLFAMIRLRNPNARLIYLTSQPVHPDIVDYYLQLLDGLPLRRARERLHLVSVHDASPRPLTQKVLERPRLLARLKRLIGDPRLAYLTCYNATPLERSLALALDIPLNGLDPALLNLGTKSGNRAVFAEAGVDHPAGSIDLSSLSDLVGALARLAEERPTARRAVVKLNEGFGGEGNALYDFPARRAHEPALRAALDRLEFTSGNETPEGFLAKFAEMGGIVEELVEAEAVQSPSVQMRIQPDGEPRLVSSHEQILGGATGQSYLGCRFPARDDYRELIQAQAGKVARVLARHGVIGRFGIDFLVYRDPGGEWLSRAIEINLRMGGTTPPFHALEFLTGGRLEAESGLFLDPKGTPKYYLASDNLKSSSYRGWLPEDLLEIVSRRGLGFDHATHTGSLFSMIGALSQYGKVGLTCIGDSPAQAEQLFERVRDVLDEEAHGGHGVLAPLLDRHLAME